MVGLPGTGKSGLAKFAGKELHAPVLDKDVIKSALVERGEEDWNRSGSLAYTILRDLAQHLLQQGFDVVVDSPGHYQRFQSDMARIADEEGSEMRLIECVCGDDTVRRERFERRKQGDKMSAQHDDLDKVLDEVERDDFLPEGLDALKVDTCVDREDAEEKVRAYLADKPKIADVGTLEPSTIKVENEEARAAAEGGG